MRVQTTYLILAVVFGAGCASSQPPVREFASSDAHITGTIAIELPKSLMAELQPPAARLVGTFEFTGHGEPISQSPVRSRYHSTLTIRVTDPDTGHTYADLRSTSDGESGQSPDDLLVRSLSEIETKLRLAGMTLQAIPTTQPTTR